MRNSIDVVENRKKLKVGETFKVEINNNTYIAIKERDNSKQIHILKPWQKREGTHESYIKVGEYVKIILKNGKDYYCRIQGVLDLGKELYKSSSSYMSYKWNNYLLAYGLSNYKDCVKRDNLNLHLDEYELLIKLYNTTDENILASNKPLRDALYKTGQVINNGFNFIDTTLSENDWKIRNLREERDIEDTCDFPKMENESDLNRELRVFKHFLNLNRKDWAQIYNRLEEYYNDKLLSRDVLEMRAGRRKERKRRRINYFSRVNPFFEETQIIEKDKPRTVQMATFVQIADNMDPDFDLSWKYDSFKFIEAGLSSILKNDFTIDFDVSLIFNEVFTASIEKKIEEAVEKIIKAIHTELNNHKLNWIRISHVNVNVEPKEDNDPFARYHFQVVFTLEDAVFYLNGFDSKNKANESDDYKKVLYALEKISSFRAEILEPLNKIVFSYKKDPEETSKLIEKKYSKFLEIKNGELYVIPDTCYTAKYHRKSNRIGCFSNQILTYYVNKEDPYHGNDLNFNRLKNDPEINRIYKEINKNKKKNEKKDIADSLGIEIPDRIRHTQRFPKPSKENLNILKKRNLRNIESYKDKDWYKELESYSDSIRYDYINTSRNTSILFSMDSIICKDLNRGINIEANINKYNQIAHSICMLSCHEKITDNEMYSKSEINNLVRTSIDFVSATHNPNYNYKSLNNKNERVYSRKDRERALIEKRYGRDVKILIVKTLTKQGYSIKHIQEETGYSKNSIISYRKEDFNNTFNRVIDYEKELENRLNNTNKLFEKDSYKNSSEEKKKEIDLKISITRNKLIKVSSALSMAQSITNTKKKDIIKELVKIENNLNNISHINNFELQQTYLDIINNELDNFIKKLLLIIEISNIETYNTYQTLKQVS